MPRVPQAERDRRAPRVPDAGSPARPSAYGRIGCTTTSIAIWQCKSDAPQKHIKWLGAATPRSCRQSPFPGRSPRNAIASGWRTPCGAHYAARSVGGLALRSPRTAQSAARALRRSPGGTRAECGRGCALAQGRCRHSRSENALHNHWPPEEAANQLFTNLFQSIDRYDLSDVGRMKFNSRVGRENMVGETTLSNEDILDVLKTLINIRNKEKICQQS